MSNVKLQGCYFKQQLVWLKHYRDGKGHMRVASGVCECVLYIDCAGRIPRNAAFLVPPVLRYSGVEVDRAASSAAGNSLNMTRLWQPLSVPLLPGNPQE